MPFGLRSMILCSLKSAFASEFRIRVENTFSHVSRTSVNFRLFSKSWVEEAFSKAKVSPFALSGIVKCDSRSEIEVEKPRIICFDLETTGFLKTDRIIEIAAMDGNGGPMSYMQSLVNPRMKIPYYASKVTQIYDSDVNRTDVPEFHIVGRAFVDFVESRREISGPNSPVILVAHNGKRFDVPFLWREFNRCGIPLPSHWLFLDSLIFIQDLYSNYNNAGFDTPEKFKLEFLHQTHFKLEGKGDSHRAGADVAMLLELMNEVMTNFNVTLSFVMSHTFLAQDCMPRTAEPVQAELGSSKPAQRTLRNELTLKELKELRRQKLRVRTREKVSPGIVANGNFEVVLNGKESVPYEEVLGLVRKEKKSEKSEGIREGAPEKRSPNFVIDPFMEAIFNAKADVEPGASFSPFVKDLMELNPGGSVLSFFAENDRIRVMS